MEEGKFGAWVVQDVRWKRWQATPTFASRVVTWTVWKILARPSEKGFGRKKAIWGIREAKSLACAWKTTNGHWSKSSC